MIKRILIFIMIFTIVINFIFYDNAYATTLSLGDIYGTDLGSEMLAFLLASLAVGVTYKSLAEAEKLFKTSELINWDEILGSAPDPPPGGGQNPNKKLITALLLGVPGGAFLSSIFGDLISWFQGLGATEGENIINIGETKIFGKLTYNIRFGTNNGYDCYVIDTNIGKAYHDIAPIGYFTDMTLNEAYITNVKPGDTIEVYHDRSYKDQYGMNRRDKGVLTIFIQGIYDIYINGGGNPLPLEDIKYHVSPISAVVTDIPPTTMPQPDIFKLQGIETIITPDGQEKVIYPGDFEDLVDEIVNSTTFDDVKNIIPGSNPYIVTETQQGLNINTGVESPYPDVNTEPIEDTAAYQGTTIGLLQSIINWLSLIRNDISSLPEKLFEVPQDLSLNFDNLKLNGFQDRFPFSIPWDIASAIGVFSSSPTEPDLTIDIDTNYFTLNHEIDISSITLPLRFARYVASVFFVLYLANKTRDLIKW